ncbi:Gamma-aminobutyric acid receptor subunit pi [Toxocara canis]|uniref:Gamma-aminobutyric acid receptor subunit pi n=1 Tax=Toxocara canis TaxID=6265 RepID=A0A0B2W1C5_TOXCA|nr:Gamma-aminobutyric acid receptor subunit pi [Toxocara canis]
MTATMLIQRSQILLFIFLFQIQISRSDITVENATVNEFNPISTTSATETEEEYDDSTNKEIPLNDREIAENILRRYRFPDSSTNISVIVHVVIDRIMAQNDLECSMRITLRQKWMEMRLAYEKERTSDIPIKLRSSAYIWNPNLIVSNALETIPIGRDEVRVFNSGLVEYVQRLMVTTLENHDLRSFPFEKRNCSIVFANEDSRAQWTRITSIMAPKTGWGVWTMLDWHRKGKTITLELKRSANIWMWTLYLPTMLLLLCSWISLWMNTKSQLSRTWLNSTAFLTILIIVICNCWSVPRTPYLKAIDIWNLLISTFAFLVILHSAIVTSSALKERESKTRTSYADEFDEKTRWLSETPYYAQLPEEQPKTAAKICDYVFRIIFPISFLAASIVYFFHFLQPYLT